MGSWDGVSTRKQPGYEKTFNAGVNRTCTQEDMLLRPRVCTGDGNFSKLESNDPDAGPNYMLNHWGNKYELRDYATRVVDLGTRNATFIDYVIMRDCLFVSNPSNSLRDACKMYSR